MNRSKTVTSNLLLLLVAFMIISCGNKTETEPVAKKQEPILATYLPESFDTGHSRTSEIRTFVGQDLYELINGGAEVYHLYQFIDVANAYYKLGETEITADIYRFGNADMAYGLFSTLRPPEPETAGLGAESFRSPISIDFVKGQFMVRITGFEPDEVTAEATFKLAEAIEKTIDGRSELPEMFSLFPAEGKTPNSEKIIAVDFMGRSGVTEVYTLDYLVEGETLTLFLAEDISGGKFAAWKGSIEAEGNSVASTQLPFDGSYSFVTSTSFYGDIVVGLKNSRLCGLVGYKKDHDQLIINWLSSF